MKKIIFLFVVIAFAFTARAQNTDYLNKLLADAKVLIEKNLL